MSHSRNPENVTEQKVQAKQGRSSREAGKRRAAPVEQSASRLAIKEGHGEAHDLGQQVGMQAAGGIEGAQHQQQGAPPLHPQRHQPQGEVDGHVLAAVQVQPLLL